MIVEARPSATICVLRDGLDGLEVLMVRRSLSARFMAGAWVFPGGVVEEFDEPLGFVEKNDATRPSEIAWARAGLRELAEEVNIWITTELFVPPIERVQDAEVYTVMADSAVDFDIAKTTYFSNWITPTIIPLRFDTRFFAVLASRDMCPDPNPEELDAVQWITPRQALDSAAVGRMTLALPTSKVLELFNEYRRVGDFLVFAQSVEEVHPVMARGRILEDGSVEALLPDDPGYDDLDGNSVRMRQISRSARFLIQQGYIDEVISDEN